MCIEISHPLRICSESNKLPDSVLIDILSVYEFGKQEDLKKMPNNLICKNNGDFWTTWERIFEIRKQNREKAEKLK